MKLREINEKPEWTFMVPDSVADWDAPSHWERARLASMQERLRKGDVLYDIGTEHGWLSVVYGSFCGHENMVLVEPSPEFWPNIRLTWQANGLNGPIGCYVAFAGAEMNGDPVCDVWPSAADGNEIGSMPYRYINQHTDIPTLTIDFLTRQGPPPNAITVDVEGAEMLVMLGAERTLREHRPLVWLSVHPDLMERDFKARPEQLFEVMTNAGYSRTLLEIDHEEHWFFAPEF